MNQTRGLLAEFGIVFAQGHRAFREGLCQAIEDEQPTPAFKATLQQLYEEYQTINQRIDDIEQTIQARLDASPDASLLQSIPAVGPWVASAVIAKTVLRVLRVGPI